MSREVHVTLKDEFLVNVTLKDEFGRLKCPLTWEDQPDLLCWIVAT